MILLPAADVGDTGAEFDRVFLQELRDLKLFVNDREIVEEHKRWCIAFFLLGNYWAGGRTDGRKDRQTD